MTGGARRFFVFCGVGGVGFLIDAGIVQALTRVAHWSPYGARVMSFVVAATGTWVANRTLTFQVRHDPTVQEWVGYTALMVLGAIVNYGAFAITLSFWPLAMEWPALGVAVGSVAGMMINFAGMKWWFERKGLSDTGATSSLGG